MSMFSFSLFGGGKQKKNKTQRLAGQVRRRLSALEQLERREMFAADLRSFDGTGNNVAHPDWGSVDENFLRKAPADYADGISAPAGADRSSAREISNLVNAIPSGEFLSQRGLSAMAYAWGQFLDHDIDLTNAATPAEAFGIAVPTGDSSFDPNGTGSATIPLTRSQFDPATGTTTPREQFNSITAFIDGSMVYGTSAAQAATLRTGSGGHMRTSTGNLLPVENGMFVAGDIRANENPDLTALQTLFVREHNRLADGMAAKNPTWNDERLFQEARRVVIGELQAITYNEFLPALIGPNAIQPYRGYNPNVNAGISNEFATAAYRLGHSMVGTDIEFLDNNGNELRDAVELRDAFFNPSILQENGIDGVLKYLSSDKSQEIDPYVVDDLRNFLFGPPGAGGLDLAALNIQRGRDHGLADYNSVRAAYGLRPVTDFSQITSNVDVQNALREAYGTVDNIDLWVGGLAEDHARGASVGPLFQRIIGDQFSRLRDGDRFYYERDLTGKALQDVKNTTLADVIRRNTGTQNLQRNVFFFNTAVSGQVFQDVNNNGRIDRGENPVVNATVTLINDAGETVATTKSTRDGGYRFADVDLGTFQVVLQLPGNVSPLSKEVAITKGGEVNGVNFGIAPSNVGHNPTNPPLRTPQPPVRPNSPPQPASPQMVAVATQQPNSSVQTPSAEKEKPVPVPLPPAAAPGVDVAPIGSPTKPPVGSPPPKPANEGNSLLPSDGSQQLPPPGPNGPPPRR